MNAVKQRAGKAGGLATLAKHGKSHFSKIGRRGAVITWQRYELRPAGVGDFAMVSRGTGEVKAFLSGRSWRGGDL